MDRHWGTRHCSVWEMRCRQLRRLQLVVSLPGIVGAVHREVASWGGAWEEPTVALRTALGAVGWQVERNVVCLRRTSWPFLLPEQAYSGDIRLEPVDCRRGGR